MRIRSTIVALLAAMLQITAAWAGPDQPTKFTEIGGVANTRHNMTQSTTQTPTAWAMASSRNDYGEVCVYCHTPHGSSTVIAAPLWNRTIKAVGYTTYDQLGTQSLTQEVSTPGANSLTCLSCHNGQVAIDSIINMPGSQGYLASQMTSVSGEFLDSWRQGGFQTPAAGSHLTLDTCAVCHQPDSFIPSATDFTVFRIGTDLTNDHPIGVTFPFDKDDFNDPDATHNSTRFFDEDGDSRPDSNEIRLYDTGDGPEVECATCHDPHGVPSGAVGSQNIRSFLRVSNAGSAVCLTCHSK